MGTGVGFLDLKVFFFFFLLCIYKTMHKRAVWRLFVSRVAKTPLVTKSGGISEHKSDIRYDKYLVMN